MIPVSNKTRSITRVRYKHPNFQRQEKYDEQFLQQSRCRVRCPQDVRL